MSHHCAFERLTSHQEAEEHQVGEEDAEVHTSPERNEQTERADCAVATETPSFKRLCSLSQGDTEVEMKAPKTLHCVAMFFVFPHT